MKPSLTKKELFGFIIFMLVGIFTWIPNSTAYAAGIIVNTAIDTAADDGYCSLREAIDNANNNNQAYSDCSAGSGQDIISFAAGITTITLNSSLQNISDAAELVIDGAGVMTINGGSYRIFAVNNNAALTLTGLTLTNGNASTHYGGAIYNLGALVVNNSNFIANTAKFGGAILSWGGSTSINSSTFSHNTSLDGGGAVLFTVSGIHTVTNSLFEDNVAYSSTTGHGSGGGIQTENGTTVNITNVTLINNNAGGTADDGGGGLMVYGGTVTVINSTFSANNSATYGGGIRQLGGAVTLRNTIVASSTAGGNCYGSVTNGGSNLVWGDTTCPGVNANPQLLALTNNGGPSYTMALGAGSAAINFAALAYCPSIDQREFARRSGFCDSGAFEAQPVTITAVSGTPQQTVASHPFADPLVASVVDGYNNHLGGIQATYTTPSSGASASLSSNIVTTDINGFGTVTASANDVIGSYVITASVSGVTIPATFSLVNTNPDVSSILRTGSNPTNAASVPFAVTFNTSVTGLDVTDFIVSVSGISGVFIQSVSGSGNNYSVLVNTGSGDGTLRLDIVDDDTIVDNFGKPLGGPGLGNGNYTNGEEYTIDKTSPDTNLTSMPSDPTNLTEASFTFSSPDGSATFECKLDSGSYEACSSPKEYTALSDGEHTFYAKAIDPAGNPDPTPASYTWTIDTAAPDTSITAHPDDPSNSAEASFSFSSTEVGSTFECNLDSGSYEACSSPKGYTALSDGEHTFYARAIDPAGNPDPTPASYTWTIDTAAPDTSITAHPDDPSNSAEASFSFSSTEVGSTFECNLDSGSYEACSSPKGYTALSDGEHTFYAKAIDPAGNPDPTPASYTWTIDTAAPDTSITAHPDDPSNSAEASFSFSSTEVGSTFECKLDSGSYEACSSPKEYTALSDGEHTFYAKAIDPAGNPDPTPASYTWTIDTAAPDTSITAHPDDPSNSAEASFSFSSTEVGSTFECNLDSGSYEACSSPKGYTALSDGEHTFYAKAIDPAGNPDPTPASYTWTIDTAAPDTSITAHPDDPSNSAEASFSFSSTEVGSTFECKLDSGSYEACSSPKGYTALSDGEHTFYAKAIDPAGNPDPTPASYTWTIDTAAPDTSITAHPDDPSNSAEASFSFSSTEVGSTFECKLDSGSYEACSSPKGYTALSDGEHTFYAKAIDPAGNPDPTPASYTWTIDTAAPDTSITAHPDDPSNSAEASFSFSSTEVGSTFECKLDSGSYEACSSPKGYTALSDGEHTFYARAIDPAGNPDPTPASYTWTIDTAVPDTSITAHPDDPSNSAEASFSFSSTEVGSTFECKLDSGSYEACSSPKGYTALSDGEHTFYARAIDPAGNPDPTPASYTWTIDTAAPDTSITAHPDDPSNSAEASFSFSSTEVGSTFECNLDSGSYEACSSPKDYIALSDGEHTFYARAIDPAGNPDPTPASYTWTIDTAAPDTSITAHPDDPSNSAEASFSFSSTEVGSTFECNLDSGSYEACSSPKGYTALSDGEHTFYAKAIDPAGNPDPTPASYTWTIDTAAPDTSITAHPDDPSNSAEASFSFSSTEVGSTFECKLDSGSYEACSSPKEYTALSDGEHTFYVRAIGPAGNPDPTPASYTWTIDTTPSKLPIYLPLIFK